MIMSNIVDSLWAYLEAYWQDQCYSQYPIWDFFVFLYNYSL